MDSEQFSAAPTTTGGLKAYYHAYGKRLANTDIEIVHFLDREEITAWLARWQNELLPIARQALSDGQVPIIGLSFYTWNAAEFLEVVQALKTSCPELLIVVGGPHVQQAEDYLYDDPIDLVVLGEGEETFKELLDCEDLQYKDQIPGLAFLADDGRLCKTTARKRSCDLDALPSALNVIALTDSEGKPLYESISYETSRGCPFRCAFCEWGTGAIGGKMYQFSMERISQDWQLIIAAGIQNIWLTDSNFGALKEDLQKAQLICELKEQTGLPSTFATSWSKKHSSQVQKIALLLNRHGLLPHYQLALQTLTPLALELSNRKNMDANKYEPIAKQMAEAGVPIAAELIWGLPGDNLASFEANLDKLLATFPNINIFGYTLLPGTEFYQRRDEYQIKAIPVAGYGKAKGEYVVGCHTFDINEGKEGYFLISAHIILIHGHVMPLTSRYLALSGGVPVSPLFRVVLRALISKFSRKVKGIDLSDRMEVYENRDLIYLAMLSHAQECYALIRLTIMEWFAEHNTDEKIVSSALQILELDRQLCPRVGPSSCAHHRFGFPARAVYQKLQAMDLPDENDFKPGTETLLLRHPGGIGEIVKGPDGGSWIKGEIEEEELCEPQTRQVLPDGQEIEIVQIIEKQKSAQAG
jgi:radical SAM superfamily enzyme YgiQ (UPF0313 family)